MRGNLGKFFKVSFVVVMVLGLVLPYFNFAQAAAGLTVEIIAAPNLIVDSNVMSPSSYQPIVATVIGKFCNTSGGTLDNVIGYIGDYASGTPGDYPDNTPGTITDGIVSTTYDGTYEFQHLGSGTDATRYIGTMQAGECSYQYWSFTYPKYAHWNGGTNNIPAWGTSVKPGDDLWLTFDIWGNYPGQTPTVDSHTMTMRNEISAMANKIEPNGNPGGRWFNTDTSTINPGETVTTNGILYRLGNVNQGFDNDNDGIPDYNAWLQPFGDPAYDPDCFRLVGTTGVLTVTTSSGDVIIPFEDSLYFTDLPMNNTNVVGEIFYTFLALGGACTIPITPYQEVASGSDNEKFNGDYGAGPDPTGSYDPKVEILKTAPGTIGENVAFLYSIPFTNTSTTSTAGLTLSSSGIDMPMVVEDTVPDGLQYICDSAAAQTTLASPNTATIYYSNDSGATWSTTQPGCPGAPVSSAPNNLYMIRWKLDNPIPVWPTAGSSGNYARFQALVPTGYITGGGDPFVENCAEGKFGTSSPAFAEACDVTMVQGNNTIGDTVWADDGGTTGIASNGVQDGDEAGIANVTVTLYWDRNGNGVVDDNDKQLSTAVTDGSGNYSFANLPDGNFLVTVDTADTDIPTGFGPTTPKFVAVALDPTGADPNPVVDNTADFGFGPALKVTKVLLSDDPAYEGDEVTFRIDLRNTLPGDGTASGFCQYTIWSGNHDLGSSVPPDGGTGNSAFVNPGYAVGSPDELYAETDLANNSNTIALNGFDALGTGNITSVSLLVHLIVIDQLQADTAEYIEYQVYRNNNGTPTDTFRYDGVTGVTGVEGTRYVHENTLSGTWSWSDFQGDIAEVGLLSNGTGTPANRGDVGVDAVAFIVTTDQVCGGADTTITELPLTDTYDGDLLEYVSADPTETTNGTSGSPPNTMGTTTWSNLGPLYAGGTKTITVTFNALDPGATTVNTINTASVANAYFGNGRPVNDDDDTADVDIIPTGSIAGTVWSEGAGGTTGWVGTTGYENLGTTDFGIENVPVTLYGCYAVGTDDLITNYLDNRTCEESQQGGQWRVVDTTTTDSDGSYIFDGLKLGFYYVAVAPPAWTGGNQSAEAGSSNTSQNGTGRTCGTCDNTWGDVGQNLTLTSFNPIGDGAPLTGEGEDITNINFGYQNVPAYVYGKVYEDNDGDGSQDDGEADYSGVTVRLCDDATCSGTVHDTVVTGSDGSYSFDLSTLGLVNTDVYVVVTQPSGTTQTDDPDNTGNCSGAGGCDNATTTAINIPAGETSGSHDFGYQPTGAYTIGDTLYRDWNGDGDQDTGEEGLPNITVYLYEDENNNGVIDPEDALIATDVTDASGNYGFGSQPDGNYIVVVDTADADFPANHTQTGDPDGPCPGATCDSRSTSAAISGADDLDNDFGYQPQGFGSIGDYVWYDTDGDGQQDASEAGASGITMNLYQDDNGDGTIDGSDALVGTTTTLGYTVIDGYLDISGNGTIGLEDSLADLYGYEVIAGALDINGDGTISTSDDGTFGPYLVFDGRLDINNDGAADTGDDGSLAGFYLFNDLPAGDFIAQVAPAEFSGGDLVGYSMTTTGTGYNVSQNSRAAELTSAALSYYDADFGFATTRLGDTVWQDNDGDGIQDAGEPGIDGVTMQLFEDTNNNGIWDAGDTQIATVDTATIDGQAGKYFFTGIPAGNYIIRVDPNELLAGGTLENYQLSGDPDVYNETFPDSVSCLTTGAMGCDHAKPYDRYDSGSPYDENPAVRPGTIELTADFGYQPQGVLGDAVWIDSDGDGVRDPEEQGIPNVTVFLCQAATPCLSTTPGVITTTTDADGAYSFGGLTNLQQYYVRVDTTDSDFPNGLTQTYGTAEQTRTIDTSVNNGVDLTVDFGYRFAGNNSIIGTAFHDDNNNAIQEAGETTTYPNVPIYLYFCGASCGDADDTLVGSMLTGPTGNYTFTQLADGLYRAIVNPNAHTLTGTDPTNTVSPTTYHDVPLDVPGTNPDPVDATDQDFGFLSALDLGDLPSDYGNTLMADNGARHIIGSVYLGTGVTVDFDGQESATATGDVDDGVVRTPLFFWTPGANGASVDVTTTCAGTCYLSAWVDWNNDDVFSGSAERVLLDRPVTNGVQTITFDIPAGTAFANTFNVRFRLYEASTNGLAQPTGLVTNGEAEDYQWNFGPNAISLSNFSAGSLEISVWPLVLTAVLVFGAVAFYTFRRRQGATVRIRRDKDR